MYGRKSTPSIQTFMCALKGVSTPDQLDDAPSISPPPPPLLVQILLQLDYVALKRMRLISRAVCALVGHPALDEVLFRTPAADRELDALLALRVLRSNPANVSRARALVDEIFTGGVLDLDLAEYAAAMEEVIQHPGEAPMAFDLHPLLARVKWFGPDEDGVFCVQLRRPPPRVAKDDDWPTVVEDWGVDLPKVPLSKVRVAFCSLPALAEPSP